MSKLFLMSIVLCLCLLLLSLPYVFLLRVFPSTPHCLYKSPECGSLSQSLLLGNVTQFRRQTCKPRG